MKKINPPGLVAIVATSLSLCLLIFAFLVCDLFQHNIFNINAKLICFFDADKILQFYKTFKMFFLDTVSSWLGSNTSFSKEVLPIGLMVLVILGEFGLSKFDLPSFIGLYNKLDEYPHPKINLSLLYIFIKVSFWVNFVSFCVFWFKNDYPPMIFTLMALIILFAIGILYRYRISVWEKRCLNKKIPKKQDENKTD